jgi:hypothetical protein
VSVTVVNDESMFTYYFMLYMIRSVITDNHLHIDGNNKLLNNKLLERNAKLNIKMEQSLIRGDQYPGYLSTAMYKGINAGTRINSVLKLSFDTC